MVQIPVTLPIDINCDLGEGDSLADCSQDALIMPYITRCNIACGGHAGNQLTMRLSIENAKRNQLLIGAHPSYPDKANFGRKKMNIAFQDLANSIVSQVNQLETICALQNTSLDHIKFHGALYNEIENDDWLCKNIFRLLHKKLPYLKIVCLAGGNLHKLCQINNTPHYQEAFVDRRYLANATLSPRTMQNAVIEDLELAIKQAVELAKQRPIETIDQLKIKIKANTLCIHGDHENSLELAKKLHQALTRLKLSPPQ